ncbi:hypothetical protein BVC71_12640 [Marivivens niveibacter]|uniref:Aminoacetone oxidase family FAD-binding enzyme n=1 Tax=Marivivens niveibacter TaxID=1930667 RepID=A0A251WWJ3_9RHOB|nr:NAD(P)/FAD-dependent oxidoreductase [Marivivens niveibacter]OUD08797.1 hypothetical protein BVC71_12640 [Marivivens niveibacter]
MKVKTLILGAGAAGMFCAAHAGDDVLVVDHSKTAGDKIRISGGGRCNFTHLETTAKNYLSQNPHFCKSALARYTPWDFVGLVSGYGIAWHEKTQGQLFCDNSAKEIIDMLRSEMDKAGAKLWLKTAVIDVTFDGQYRTRVTRDGQDMVIMSDNLVVATGGKSIPKMGATGIGYKIAEDFGIPVTQTRPALVPFTFSDARFAGVSGISAPVLARANDGPEFADALLCTHRGLSGPAMLQVSSYWHKGEEITINLIPSIDIVAHLKKARTDHPRKAVTTVLGSVLPSRLINHLAEDFALTDVCAQWSDKRIDDLATALRQWQVKPSGTEGYRTAEVTLGGVDTDYLSSKTMESKTHKGLYFIGECVDVTGWLGGYNFQWAWASAYAAGTAISG